MEEKEKRKNQNLDGWRRINKGIEIDGTPEYEFVDPEFPDPEEDSTAQILPPPPSDKLTRRSVDTNVLETGFTTAKKTPPITQIDAGTSADVQRRNLVYYPRKENDGNENLPKTSISDSKTKELPQGIVTEYKQCNITINLTFYQEDWDRIYKLIKAERDTIKQFARRAMVKLAEEIIERNIIKRRLVEELTKIEVMNSLKDKLREELSVEQLIWQAKYKDRDPDAVKLYPSLNEEMKKQLEAEENERKELAERIKRKAERDALKEAREARARARELKKAQENTGNPGEIIAENTEQAPKEEENFALDIKMEGVMPEEKGVPQDVGAQDAPVPEDAAGIPQEEITT